MATDAEVKEAISKEIEETISTMLAHNRALSQLPPDGDADWTRKMIKITTEMMNSLSNRVISLEQKQHDLESKQASIPAVPGTTASGLTSP